MLYNEDSMTVTWQLCFKPSAIINVYTLEGHIHAILGLSKNRDGLYIFLIHYTHHVPWFPTGK